MLTIRLPLPPSVNNMFGVARTTGRRFKSRTYKRWCEDADFELVRQRANKVRLPGKYSIIIGCPQGMRGDVDNRVKAILDLFVRWGITDDDKHCRRMVAEKVAGIERDTCIVTIEAME